MFIQGFFFSTCLNLIYDYGILPPKYHLVFPIPNRILPWQKQHKAYYLINSFLFRIVSKNFLSLSELKIL